MWSDASGKGVNAIQATGENRPVANGSGGIVLTPTTWLDVAGLAADDTDQSIFALMKVTALSGNQTILGAVGGDGSAGGRQLRVTEGGAIEYMSGGWAYLGGSSSGLIAANTDFLLGFIPKSSPSGADQHMVYINGVAYQIGDGAASFAAGMTSQIGRRETTETLTGVIYQLFALTGNPVDDVQRQKIEGRIAWDNAKAALLPSGHPYRAAPPLR